MKTLRRTIHLTLNEEPIDAWLSKWGSFTVGLLLFALTAGVLPSQASCQAELLLGIGVASVACSNLFLFGVLSRQVHLAWHRGAVPWRARVGEFLGLGIGIAIVAGGASWIVMFLLAPPAMLIGGLLVLSLAIAIMCLGLWSTLSQTSAK